MVANTICPKESIYLRTNYFKTSFLEKMNNQLTRTSGKISSPVTKPQQDFNKLTEKIARLRAEIDSTKSLGEHLEKRLAAEYEPAVRAHNSELGELVRVFDRAYQSGNFKGRDLKKLEHLILDMVFPLIEEGDNDDLKEIHDRYSDEPFDEIDAEADEDVAELMREMMENMFGIKMDDDADISDPQKFQAHLAEKMGQNVDESNYRQANHKKSKKQQEKADKKAEEDAKISKSVREVYMDLVKTFHPDREPDEAEKIRKTAIMQRVTAAYEKNDLLILLELQLEFERIDAQSLNSIAEEKLIHFNKVLSKQARDLNNELNDFKSRIQELGSMLSGMGGFYMQKIKSEQIEIMLNQKIRDIKKKTDLLKKDVRDLSSYDALKGFLKSYQIPKASKNNGFFFDF